MRIDGPSDYETRIVRVFPDYAESVIWFSDPVPYDESQLSDELVERLKAWDSFYYSHLDPDLRWTSVKAREEFGRQGMELCDAMSSEIGSEFEVEFVFFGETIRQPRLRAHGPATNGAARDAFATLAREAYELWGELSRRRTEKTPGVSFGWFARRPPHTGGS